MLTAVIIILVGGFGVVYLGASSGGPASDDPLLEAEVTVTHADIAVVHGGGTTVDVDDLVLRLGSDGTTTRYPFDTANVTRNVTADGWFEPGERFVREHGLSPGPVTVMVVHEPSNAVVEQDYLDIPPADASSVDASGGTVALASMVDWDGGTTDPRRSPSVDRLELRT